ncbi:hypothetical protein ACJIZ3_013651 [Penstemon smallii]|uniref:Uncharacterized protein n=1 Tax=Penstemon smallii TaxID=265156 RepID=A0ABD3RHM0_9LAMI
MAIILRLSCKGISTGETFLSNNITAWVCRGYVSVTRPSHKAKFDKETCEKVIDAADTVKDGTKKVVQEVKRIGQVVTDKIANTTGNMMADVAKKGFEKAAESAETQKGKDVLDTAKVATEAFKKRVSDK